MALTFVLSDSTDIDFHQVGDGSTNPAGIPEGALAGPENGNQSNGVPLTG